VWGSSIYPFGAMVGNLLVGSIKLARTVTKRTERGKGKQHSKLKERDLRNWWETLIIDKRKPQGDFVKRKGGLAGKGPGGGKKEGALGPCRNVGHIIELRLGLEGIRANSVTSNRCGGVRRDGTEKATRDLRIGLSKQVGFSSGKSL